MCYNPIIIDEIESEVSNKINIDWKKPSTELLKIYKSIGNDKSQPTQNGSYRVDYRDNYTE